jgi:hypothetical protein
MNSVKRHPQKPVGFKSVNASQPVEGVVLNEGSPDQLGCMLNGICFAKAKSHEASIVLDHPVSSTVPEGGHFGQRQSQPQK